MSLDPQTMASFLQYPVFVPRTKYLTESMYREKTGFWLMVSVTLVCVVSSVVSGYAEEGSQGREYEAEAPVLHP